MSERAQRILIVDDDRHNVGLMKELVRTLGYDVDAVGDGEAALSRVRSDPPDLVLLDVGLPKVDGFDVLKEIKGTPATRDLPVVIVTALADMESKVRGIELGADDYLTKPFKLFELQTRIRAALQVRQYQDRLRSAERALSEQGENDPVTGAGQFAHLHAQLDYEVTRARRYGRPLSGLLVSVDDYIALRGRLGPEGGDRLLRDVVEALRTVTRNVDRVFRLDVEEFVVLLPETPLPGAVVVAERIQAKVLGLGPEVRCSIGVATFPHSDIRGGEDLLRAADQAVRAARSAGPGHVAQFGG